MKKNKFLKIASGLLMLVLITCCAVSGTFAKYVTEGSATDIARVAKWGVQIGANTSTTITTYEINTTTKDDQIESATTDVVLAPGSEIATMADISISGAPEVDVNVSYVANLVLTGWEVDGSYYCPLYISVNGNVIHGLTFANAADFEAAVEAAIAALSDNYEANEDLSAVTAPIVTVQWAFSSSAENDVKDTALGNLLSLPVISLTITATITQID